MTVTEVGDYCQGDAFDDLTSVLVRRKVGEDVLRINEETQNVTWRIYDV